MKKNYNITEPLQKIKPNVLVGNNVFTGAPTSTPVVFNRGYAKTS